MQIGTGEKVFKPPKAVFHTGCEEEQIVAWKQKHVPPPPAPVHERKRPEMPRLKLPVEGDEPQVEKILDKLLHEEVHEVQTMNGDMKYVKGHGRGSNMGLPVEEFKTMEQMNQEEHQAGIHGLKNSGRDAKEPEPESAIRNAWKPPTVPESVVATDEDVAGWFKTNYKVLGNATPCWPPTVGDNVLWRGIATGKHGFPSTKEEWFNGVVMHIRWDYTDDDYRYGVT